MYCTDKQSTDVSRRLITVIKWKFTLSCQIKRVFRKKITSKTWKFDNFKVIPINCDANNFILNFIAKLIFSFNFVKIFLKNSFKLRHITKKI